MLARLEKWAEKQIGAERDRITELISFLRKSPTAAGSEPVFAEMAMLGTRTLHYADYAAAPRQKEEAEVQAISEMEEETRKREAEFENRLRSLEARIRQAEQVTHECSEEMRKLLEAFARDQEARAQRKGISQNQPGD